MVSHETTHKHYFYLFDLSVSVEFIKIVNLVKLDMLGVERYVEGRISEVINVSGYGLEDDDFEVAMEALSYCILHIAKVNAATPEAFQSIFETMLLKEDF